MNDTFLHPDGARADTNRGLDNFRHKFGAAKDVDDVHALGNVLQASIRFLTKHLGLGGIDRNDAVAGGLQILRNAVARTMPAVRETNNGNRAAGLENLTNGISSNGLRSLTCVGAGACDRIYHLFVDRSFRVRCDLARGGPSRPARTREGVSSFSADTRP